jgi:16S rRNA (adenine1518-N6/adenine1519-N6)-dimethyltransferase
MLQKPAVDVVDERLMFELIKHGFAKRRKLLLNSLAGVRRFEKLELRAAFNELGLDGKIRAEQMDLELFAKLSNNLSEKMAGENYEGA